MQKLGGHFIKMIDKNLPQFKINLTSMEVKVGVLSDRQAASVHDWRLLKLLSLFSFLVVLNIASQITTHVWFAYE